MNRDVEWLCYHLVTDGLLTAEDCRAVAQAMAEAGLDIDAETFAQVLLDNDLIQDGAALNQLKDMAIGEARALAFPPESVFEEAAEAPPPEPKKPARPAAPAPKQRAEAGPATPAKVDIPPGTSDWLQGWPDLNEAAGMHPTDAVELLNSFLHKARTCGCSDVHISAGAIPFVRRNKDIHSIPGLDLLTREAAESLNLSPLSDEYREIFERTHDLDYCYAIEETDRYRTNVLRQRLGVSGSYRVVDSHIRSLRELGFVRADVIEKLTTYHQGLVLITGPVGCGKSTTLASLVDLINRTRQDHIVCVEDPIEVVFHPRNCNITQRELNRHTRSFANALRGALREDPDIIVIGELRDLDTIEMAIRAAETGHLVFGTLHTGSAASTMDRLLDVFPPNQQAQIRAMAAESLKAVICQQLLQNHDGTGVVMACEMLLATLAVSNLIREGKTYQLDSIMQTSRNLGMSTMEQSYMDLYLAGKRSYEQTLPLLKTNDLIRELQTHAARAMSESSSTKKRKWV